MLLSSYNAGVGIYTFTDKDGRRRVLDSINLSLI